MVRVENGVVLYTPYGEEEIPIGNIENAEVFDDYLSLGGHGFPLERFAELERAFKELYPNGKPVPEVPQVNPQLSLEERVQLLQATVDSMIMGV